MHIVCDTLYVYITHYSHAGYGRGQQFCIPLDTRSSRTSHFRRRLEHCGEFPSVHVLQSPVASRGQVCVPSYRVFPLMRLMLDACVCVTCQYDCAQHVAFVFSVSRLQLACLVDWLNYLAQLKRPACLLPVAAMQEFLREGDSHTSGLWQEQQSGATGRPLAARSRCIII